jgi:hypothetical protein
MKRFALIVAAAFGLALSNGAAYADWGNCRYSGYQPWWNPLACCSRKCKTCEEKRLEHFWHDYYDALRRYYKSLEHIDWVTYYKNHGYPTNGGACGAGCGASYCGPNGGCPQVNYAPVFVNPTMQWAIPAGCGGMAGCGAPMSGPGAAMAGPGCQPVGY